MSDDSTATGRALVIIVGPTGSGKSDLALAIAERFSGEIVNCDSLQLYRFLDIGTAKTPASERRGIPHHLFDILNPDEVFTAGDYIRVARPLLQDIANRGRLPVVVGGTGFYLRALLNGLFTGPSRDEALRARLQQRAGKLHRILGRLDPQAAQRIHANDTNKLIRAIEICLLARKPMSDLFLEPTDQLSGFQPVKVGLNPPRDELVARLNERCERMFSSGLIEEVESVLKMGFAASAKAFESIGYREAVLAIQGALTREEAIRQAQGSTRQYAKRQRTWFRREAGVKWIDEFGNLDQTIQNAFRLVENHIKHS